MQKDRNWPWTSLVQPRQNLGDQRGDAIVVQRSQEPPGHADTSRAQRQCTDDVERIADASGGEHGNTDTLHVQEAGDGGLAPAFEESVVGELSPTVLDTDEIRTAPASDVYRGHTQVAQQQHGLAAEPETDLLDDHWDIECGGDSQVSVYDPCVHAAAGHSVEVEGRRPGDARERCRQRDV